MATLPTTEKKKLAVFVALVVLGVSLVWRGNRWVRDREAQLTQDAGADVLHALQTLLADPAHASMTMGKGFFAERQGRHVYARLLAPVDVMVLGHSDADHMSQTSFRPGVRFYNGFLSNSHLVYQAEVFDELVAHTGHVPKLVLVDVRSTFYLREGDEPGEEIPDKDTRFTNGWGGRWETGPIKAPAWYADFDSMLSLQQTLATLQWVGRHIPGLDRPPPTGDTTDPYHILPRAAKSDAYRMLADGSRVYPGEVEGVIVPRGIQGEDPKEEVRANEVRLRRLDSFLRKLAKATTVIVYSPPLKPSVSVDPRVAKLRLYLLGRVAKIAAQVGVDYYDMSLLAAQVGCDEHDFYDELHISRHCNDRLLHALPQHAPRAGAKLGEALTP
jgi:hypothetical protein